jgi:hypothetical protein
MNRKDHTMSTTSKQTTARRLDRRNCTTRAVLEQMRNDGAALRFHFEHSGPEWVLTTGGVVPADVAALVIVHPNIVGVGNCLFPSGPSQTWRWAK